MSDSAQLLYHNSRYCTSVAHSVNDIYLHMYCLGGLLDRFSSCNLCTWNRIGLLIMSCNQCILWP